MNLPSCAEILEMKSDLDSGDLEEMLEKLLIRREELKSGTVNRRKKGGEGGIEPIGRAIREIDGKIAEINGDFVIIYNEE